MESVEVGCFPSDDAEACQADTAFLHESGSASVFTMESATPLVQDEKESFIAQSLLHAVPNLCTPSSWATVRRSVAESLRCTYQHSLPTSFHNELVFEQGFHVSSNLRGESSAVLASTGSSASEHDDVKRFPTTETSVIFSSPTAEGTSKLGEGPTGLVFSVLLAFSSFSGSLTAGKKSSQPEVFSLPVAYQPQVLLVFASNVLWATLSVVLLRAASPLDSTRPSFSGAAQMGSANADIASSFRRLFQYLRDHLTQRNAEFPKPNGKYIKREEFFTFREARSSNMKSRFVASHSDCDVLLAVNDDLLNSWGTDWKEL